MSTATKASAYCRRCGCVRDVVMEGSTARSAPGDRSEDGTVDVTCGTCYLVLDVVRRDERDRNRALLK